MPAVPAPTPQPLRRAQLVGLALRGQPRWAVEDHLSELAELAKLAKSAGLEVAGSSVQTAAAPHVRTFIGPGKAEEVGRAARRLGVCNKVDRLGAAEAAARNGHGVWVSAATGEGLERLLPAIRGRMAAVADP